MSTSIKVTLWRKRARYGCGWQSENLSGGSTACFARALEKRLRSHFPSFTTGYNGPVKNDRIPTTTAGSQTHQKENTWYIMFSCANMRHCVQSEDRLTSLLRSSCLDHQPIPQTLSPTSSFQQLCSASRCHPRQPPVSILQQGFLKMACL